MGTEYSMNKKSVVVSYLFPVYSLQRIIWNLEQNAQKLKWFIRLRKFLGKTKLNIAMHSRKTLVSKQNTNYYVYYII